LIAPELFTPAAGALPGTTLLTSLQLAVRDTVIAVAAPAPEWRVWLATLTDAATVVIALALLVAVFILLLIALQIRRLIRRVDPLLDQIRTHVDPVLGNVRDVSQNVNYMSAAIRSDVQQLTELVDTSRRRLNRAADSAEQRIREFNALLGVMQEEAEQLFIDTAATIRGVQAGTESYRSLRGNGRTRAAEDASTGSASLRNRNREEP
jgi:predicted PurR-regulated permease PerM